MDEFISSLPGLSYDELIGLNESILDSMQYQSPETFPEFSAKSSHITLELLRRVKDDH